MYKLPGEVGTISGLGLLWTSLSGAYLVKGLYQAVTGNGSSKDFDGETGLLRFTKRPIRRLFIGIGLNGAICVAAYNSYCFGISNFGWLQSLVDYVSNPGSTNSDELSILIGSTLLFAHTQIRWYQSVYINILSAQTTQGFLDWLAPHLYTICAGITLLSEAPALDGSGRGWFDWSSFSWRHIAGVALFALVSYQDSKLQCQLAKLRKNRAGHVVSEDHKLPKGGWFDYTLSPQFFTEILAHGAIGLTVGFHHSSWWLCSGYVTVSQIVRALGRRQWYQKKFEIKQTK
ncbi:Steroid 5 alpha-reductase 3 [Mactra antiquata]